MWKLKSFKTSDELHAWIKNNEERYLILPRFIKDMGLVIGYWVEYCEKN